MAKFIAADAILGASIGAEAASGVGLPLAFISAGILGTIKIAHAVKHKREEKENKRQEEERKAQEEIEHQRQLEQIARDQENLRLA